MTKIRFHPGKGRKSMHMFLFLGASPDDKKGVSLRTSGLLRTSKTVRNGTQVSVFMKEETEVCMLSPLSLRLEQPLTLR